MKRYPWLEGAVRHGRAASAAWSLIAAIAVIVCFVRTQSIWTLSFGLVSVVVGYVVLRILTDLLDLVADTLLPK